MSVDAIDLVEAELTRVFGPRTYPLGEPARDPMVTQAIDAQGLAARAAMTAAQAEPTPGDVARSRIDETR